jgi:hypothetical protein
VAMLVVNCLPSFSLTMVVVERSVALSRSGRDVAHPATQFIRQVNRIRIRMAVQRPRMGGMGNLLGSLIPPHGIGFGAGEKMS